MSRKLVNGTGYYWALDALHIKTKAASLVLQQEAPKIQIAPCECESKTAISWLIAVLARPRGCDSDHIVKAFLSCWCWNDSLEPKTHNL